MQSIRLFIMRLLDYAKQVFRAQRESMEDTLEETNSNSNKNKLLLIPRCRLKQISLVIVVVIEQLPKLSAGVRSEALEHIAGLLVIVLVVVVPLHEVPACLRNFLNRLVH